MHESPSLPGMQGDRRGKAGEQQGPLVSLHPPATPDTSALPPLWLLGFLDQRWPHVRTLDFVCLIVLRPDPLPGQSPLPASSLQRVHK